MVPHGLLSLVLHAHLPYVRHLEHPDSMEEQWLFEAIGETYLPLIGVMERQADAGVAFELTMTVTPPLCEMLADPALQARYGAYLDSRLRLGDAEKARSGKGTSDAERELARYYRDRFADDAHRFRDVYGGNLVNAFRALQDRGVLEIITCGATHGFLPAMQDNGTAVRAQIEVGANNYEKHFGRRPRGIWLPECGYYPGVETYLADAGIEFFLVERDGLLHGSPRPTSAVFTPVMSQGVAAFGRDSDAARQVWDAHMGYPGDPVYRDFYRDVGFDRDMEDVVEHLPGDLRGFTGYKYHRVTSSDPRRAKEHYVRDWAVAQAGVHARHFVSQRIAQAQQIGPVRDGRPPVVVCPYDAELLGHWWYEGPEFLEGVIAATAESGGALRLISPGTYLDTYPKNQEATPDVSSWGENGDATVWVDECNQWIYPRLHAAAHRVVAQADHHPHASGILERALNQMARELLLAQSSDWAFIMYTGTTVNYAVRRTLQHLDNLKSLDAQIGNGTIDGSALEAMEAVSPVFGEIDYRVYLSR